MWVIHQNAGSDGFYANAGACIIRGTSPRRTLFGRVNWNLDEFDNYETNIGFQVNVRVALHEIFHIMGFSGSLLQYFDQTNVT